MSTADADEAQTGAMAMTSIVIVTWNHLETTTRPCIESLLAFTELPFRLVCVDNASTDGTIDWFERLRRGDPRFEILPQSTNLGWAEGSLRGLDALAPIEGPVCLLNSDTILTPRWLERLLGHLSTPPFPTAVIPNEYPEGLRTFAPEAPLLRPGSAPKKPSPSTEALIAYSERVAQAMNGRSHPCLPSGFCLLIQPEGIERLREYLEDFDAFHQRKRDFTSWWETTGLSCRVALDTFVYHSRGGSGGYYGYHRLSPL